jgi:hypothetical protein
MGAVHATLGRGFLVLLYGHQFAPWAISACWQIPSS